MIDSGEHMKKMVLALASLVWTTSALAGEDYRCKIERIESAQGENSATLQFERKNHLGKDFSVDRRTGITAGALKNAGATNPVVIDRGSSENAFRAVTTMRIDQGAGAGSLAILLVINEFEDTDRKPFVFVDGTTVYFGGCVHF